MSKLRNALVYSILSQYSIQFISIISIAILARLLTPAEIGVFAIASSLTFLATELRGLGVGQYLIREKEIDNSKIRSATGLMICMSWGLAALIAASALSVADFYQQSALAIILWIMVPAFILAPFTGIPSALLKRNLHFKEIFIVRLLASIARSGSTIIYVLLGYSYYGLALGILTGAIVECLSMNYYRPAGTPWLPSFSGIKRSMIRFGMYVSGGNLLQQFSQSIPDLVLGKVTTMTEVGLFSRGLGLILFINKILVLAVKPVVLPHLSKVNREGDSVADAYLNAIVLQSAFCVPVYAAINLVSFPVIRAMFGDQWDFAVPIASILALWAIFQSIHYFSSQALLAVKKEKVMFSKEVAIFTARLVAIVCAAPYGLEAVAWAMVISGVVEFVINTYVVKMVLGLKVHQQIIALLPTLFVTLISWLSLLFLTSIYDIEGNNAWLSLAVIAPYAIVVWLLSLWLVKHQAWPIIVQMAQKLFIKT